MLMPVEEVNNALKQGSSLYRQLTVAAAQVLCASWFKFHVSFLFAMSIFTNASEMESDASSISYKVDVVVVEPSLG